jgi:hypothetical protein
MKAQGKEWNHTAQKMTVNTVLLPFLKQVPCPLTRDQKVEHLLHPVKKQLLQHPTELQEVIQLMLHHLHQHPQEEILLLLLGTNNK